MSSLFKNHKRLIRKLAYYFVADGGTCDAGDLLDMIQEAGIDADIYDALDIADECRDIRDKLLEKSMDPYSVAAIVNGEVQP